MEKTMKMESKIRKAKEEVTTKNGQFKNNRKHRVITIAKLQEDVKDKIKLMRAILEEMPEKKMKDVTNREQCFIFDETDGTMRIAGYGDFYQLSYFGKYGKSIEPFSKDLSFLNKDIDEEEEEEMEETFTQGFKMKVGTKVKALVSRWKGKTGTIVEIEPKRALPIAVTFDARMEVDFKADELIEVDSNE